MLKAEEEIINKQKNSNEICHRTHKDNDNKDEYIKIKSANDMSKYELDD